HRQADAGAFELGLGVEAVEELEELIRVLHVEADAVVAHEERVALLGGLAADLDEGVGAAAAAELERVVGGVREQAVGEGAIGPDVEAGLDPRAPGSTPAVCDLEDLGGELIERDPLDAQWLLAGAAEAEQALDERRHALAGALDGGEEVLALRRQLAGGL